MTARRPVVLAVEDEQSIVELLAHVVQPLGVELVSASTVAQALVMLETIHPALVTLDLVLPDLDGFTVLEHVRARRDFDDVPLIAISALSDSVTVKRAYQMGVADFVAKPFAVDLLDAKLRVFLKMRHLADEIRERERFLVEVVENLASGLMVCDADGRLVRINAAGAAQLGLARADAALGLHLAEVAPGAEPLLAFAPPSTKRRATVRTALGTRQLGYTTGALAGGGRVVVFRVLDGSDDAGEQQDRRLEERLALAARSFAHEVRNPITAISAAAQMLRHPRADDAMRERLGRAIEGEAERIGGLVREYVERRYVPAATAAVDLCALAHEVVEVNLVDAGARERVRVECEASVPRVRGDAGKLKQVIVNLLNNALAATAEGGAVAVRVVAASTAERGVGVRLVVSDTGHGIAAPDLPRIFDESYSRRPGGDGLGLPIARRIVDAHGGTLELTSARGVGTTVTAWLPAER